MVSAAAPIGGGGGGGSAGSGGPGGLGGGLAVYGAGAEGTSFGPANGGIGQSNWNVATIGNNGELIVTYTAESVPEPSTIIDLIGMVGMGLVAIAWHRWSGLARRLGALCRESSLAARAKRWPEPHAYLQRMQ